MEELFKNPSEEIYEIEFSGKFIPEKFVPIWFASKNLLGKEEAENTIGINVSEGNYCAFKTDFIEIYVEPDRFRILSKNLKSYDLVNDMAISVAKILKDSLNEYVSINFRFHFSYKTNKELTKVLNKLISKDEWSEIFNSPQLLGLRMNELFEDDEYKGEKRLSIFPCERADMQNTVHLYIKNNFASNSPKFSVISILEEHAESINSNIKFANKILKKYF